MTSESDPEGPWGPRKADLKPPPPTEPAPQTKPATSADPAPSREEVTPVIFHGSRRDWVGIMARGMALYLPTFGFYRFWLKTEQRRFLWRSISVNDEALAYHGTARELLVGFLFAIAVYLPISVTYFILGLYAETVQAFASVPFALFTIVFSYFAAYRARRYRLTRTVFRGVRFWMDGSAWRFAFTALGWMVATGLTLGIAWPWMAARLERFKWRHSHFGDLQGDFHGTGWGLFKALFWPALGLVVGAFIPIANLLAIPIMISAIIAVYGHWLIGGVSFGPVRFQSSIDSFMLLGPAVVTALAVGLFGAVWIGIGYVGFWGSLLGLASFEVPQGSDAEVLGALVRHAPWLLLGFAWGLIGLVGITFLKSLFFDFPRMQRFAASTSLTNAEALETVVQKGHAEGSLGEGLADALGSDGF